jgi:hypothetical protein
VRRSWLPDDTRGRRHVEVLLTTAQLKGSESEGLISMKRCLDHPEREFQTRPDRARLELQQSGIPSVVIRAVDYLD